MAKANFTIPSRIRSITGKLEVTTGTHGEFVVRDNKTRRCFLLAEGDRVTIGEGKSAQKFTVKFHYNGKDKLNGNIGTLISLTDKDEWGYERHIFFWRMPVERDEILSWLSAYMQEKDVTVDFAAKPLTNPSKKFVSGRLEAFHEQGMEGNIGWSVFDTQKHSYAALNMLREDDKLTIYNKTGTRIIWQGTMTKRRMEALQRSCYDRQKKPTPEIQFLIQSFFQELPCVLEKAKPDEK